MINSIEALLLGAGRPITLSEIRSILSNNGSNIELSDIKKALNFLEQRYIDTSIEIHEVASGYRRQIKQDHSSYLAILWNDKSPRISKALMESIIK